MATPGGSGIVIVAICVPPAAASATESLATRRIPVSPKRFARRVSVAVFAFADTPFFAGLDLTGLRRNAIAPMVTL